MVARLTLVHKESQVGMIAALGSVIGSQPERAGRVKTVDRARSCP
jgi:hypothetical protein